MAWITELAFKKLNFEHGLNLEFKSWPILFGCLFHNEPVILVLTFLVFGQSFNPILRPIILISQTFGFGHFHTKFKISLI
jgi:hypothetical protein